MVQRGFHISGFLSAISTSSLISFLLISTISRSAPAHAVAREEELHPGEFPERRQSRITSAARVGRAACQPAHACSTTYPTGQATRIGDSLSVQMHTTLWPPCARLGAWHAEVQKLKIQDKYVKFSEWP